MTVLLVRHARAGRRERWQGDDRLRPLTKRGQAQATALVALVQPWLGPDPDLRSSPWVRCVQTLEPLARAVGVAIGVEDILGEGMGPKALAALPDWLRETTVVLCSHGDVIEHVLVGLAESGVEFGSRPRTAKGSVWVLEGAHGMVERVQYLAPA